MNAQDKTNYLLLEIYGLRERAERCRERSHLLLEAMVETSTDLLRIQERFHLTRFSRVDVPESPLRPADR